MSQLLGFGFVALTWFLETEHRLRQLMLGCSEPPLTRDHRFVLLCLSHFCAAILPSVKREYFSIGFS